MLRGERKEERGERKEERGERREESLISDHSSICSLVHFNRQFYYAFCGLLHFAECYAVFFTISF